MNKINSFINTACLKYKEKSKKSKLFFTHIIYALIFCLFFLLFLAQASKFGGRYQSDLAVHMTFAKEGRGYSGLYKLMGLLYNLFNNDVGIFLLGALIVTATVYATAKFVSIQLNNDDFLLCTLIALPIDFLTGIAVPFLYFKFYSGHFIAQPYHNYTYYGMRLFAVVAMLFFQKIFDGYLKGIKPLYWVILSLCLALSTAVKPSFFYGFALTLLIFLIIDFCKLISKKELSLKTFGLMLLMGVVVFPSLYVILKQILTLYNPTAQAKGNGIAFVWGKNLFKAGAYSLIVKTVLDLAFPFLVVKNNKSKLTRFEKFTYTMFFVQIAVFTLLGETGARETHGNFYWGVYCAGFFMFLVAALRFIKDVIAARNGEKKKYLTAAGILFAAHYVCSIVYFCLVFAGEHFMV